MEFGHSLYLGACLLCPFRHHRSTMKRILLAFASLSLVACVDTTGISAESSKYPHPSTGNNAIVTVTEYGDLQCPACRAAHTTLVKPLIEQYGTRISYEYRQFPLVSLHRYAMDAAEATECAADQGKFWELVDLIYTEQEKLTSDQLTVWGEQLGLDMDLYGRCRDSHIKRDVVMADYDAGKAVGVSGTPTFFVNDQRVESTGAALIQAIDSILGSAATRL
jgi:protein-disulfide isomerase